MTLNIKTLPKSDGRTAQLPRYQTDSSAAADICAFLDSPIELEPMKRALVPTGIALEIPHGYAGFVMARSGLAAKQGLALSNGVGLIDADYRGEVMVAITNFGDSTAVIEDGQRIAQLLVLPVCICDIVPIEQLSSTDRGDGGFGSTGKG